MSFEEAEQLANAVLYEGYLLYPYRASSLKNRYRWQFGVLTPRSYSEASGSDPWFAQTECLIEPDGAEPAVDVRMRCLQIVGDRDDECVIDLYGLSLRSLLSYERIDNVVLSGTNGRKVEACVRTSAEWAGLFIKLRLRIENLTPFEAGGGRDAALRAALVSTHALIGTRDGRFVSILEPPPEAADAAASCVNLHAWPVLVGDRKRRDTMLSSPIVLYDFPAIAPESPGALCDATEIDEILALRILTLTDDEKREARATDPRSAGIVNRVDSMTGEAPPEAQADAATNTNRPDRHLNQG